MGFWSDLWFWFSSYFWVWFFSLAVLLFMIYLVLRIVKLVKDLRGRGE